MTFWIWQISLLIVIVVAVRNVWQRYGVFSIGGISSVAFFIYSIPAILGLMITPIGGSRYFLTTSPEATSAMLIAWIVYAVAMQFLSLRRSFLPNAALSGHSPDVRHLDELKLFTIISAIVALGIYFYLAYLSSPFFFLQSREEATSIFPEVQALWRWVIAMMLLAALLLKSRAATFLGLVLVSIIFFSGDRTLLFILIFAGLVCLFSRRDLSIFFKRPLLSVFLALAAALMLVAKPLYRAVKNGDWYELEYFFGLESNAARFAGFEPFLVHSHLETVIAYDWYYPISEVARNALGQFTIVPSVFGFESEQFNIAFTQRFYPNVDFGLAFNYWAEGYSVGGTLGIALFSLLFAGTIVLLDHIERSARPIIRIPVAIGGAAWATYIYRNSLENILAFERQIALVGIALVTATIFISVSHRKMVTRETASFRVQQP